MSVAKTLILVVMFFFAFFQQKILKFVQAQICFFFAV